MTRKWRKNVRKTGNTWPCATFFRYSAVLLRGLAASHSARARNPVIRVQFSLWPPAEPRTKYRSPRVNSLATQPTSLAPASCIVNLLCLFELLLWSSKTPERQLSTQVHPRIIIYHYSAFFKTFYCDQSLKVQVYYKTVMADISNFRNTWYLFIMRYAKPT